jgi:hypothetical protein
METLRAAWAWLSDAPRHRTGIRALQIAVGLLFWFRAATEFRSAGYLWGPHGVTAGQVHAIAGHRLGGFPDWAFRTELGTNLAVLSMGLAGAALVFGLATRSATAWLLLGALVFEARFSELLDGGDNVTRIVLVYMLLLLPARSNPPRGSLRVFFHNLGVVAIAAQLCVVYMTAGFMKATGARWSQGTALYLVSQVDWFSLPSSRGMFKIPLVATLSAYVTIFFQLWFPIAMFSRLRLLWVVIGIGMHLGIAVMMGLIPFSTVMIGLELVLVGDETYAKAWSLVTALRRRWLDTRPLPASEDTAHETA